MNRRIFLAAAVAALALAPIAQAAERQTDTAAWQWTADTLIVQNLDGTERQYPRLRPRTDIPALRIHIKEVQPNVYLWPNSAVAVHYHLTERVYDVMTRAVTSWAFDFEKGLVAGEVK